MKYKIIKNQLHDLINSDIYKINDSLPSEKKLSFLFGVARNTVRKCINELVTDGFLFKIHGSGTFIKKKIKLPIVKNLLSYSEEVLSIEGLPSNKIVNFAIINAPLSIAKQLKIATNSKIYNIHTLRMIDNITVSLDETFISVKKYPDLSIKDIENSKLKFFENKNIIVKGSYQVFTPQIADENVAELLNIENNSLLLKISSIDIDINNNPLCMSVSLINIKEYNIKFFINRKN